MGRFGFVDGLKVGAKALVVSIVAGLAAGLVYMLAKYVAESFVALGWLLGVAGLVFYLWLWGVIAHSFWKWG